MDSDIPKSRQDEVVSYYKSQNLVESPSGDHFIVHWCYELFPGERLESKTPPSSSSSSSYYRKKPKSFMVRESEAFCVSATEYPANCVYYADYGFGFYDLSSNTLHDLTGEAVASSLYMWLAPLQ
uniref:DUF295 domain-containing protein n=2 Tax=Brassica oleracea TaxID=3712 RepID=A0A0D3AHM0_BRAOL|nr:unnamed protein product [Brassica oleracea]